MTPQEPATQRAGAPRTRARAAGSSAPHALAPAVLLAPTLVLLVLLLAAPGGYVGWLSFQKSTYGQDATFVGLANYTRILTDPIFWRAFWNTFFVVNAVVYGELALGLALAVLMSGWVPGKKAVIAIILAPYAITETSGIVMWRYMLEPDVGMVTQWMLAAGLPQLDWNTRPFVTLSLVSLIGIWHHMPFTFLILYAALTTVPKDVLEAAEIDGATRWQRFRRVTLPMIMPAVMIAILFRYIFAIRMFSEVWLLTQGGPARLSELLAIYLYRETFKYNDFGAAAATGWCMLALSLAIAVPYLRKMYADIGRGHG
ncbi:MAG: sugar ABC transporter permease [Burkholderiales bacterium]|nr:sugar ABC transporter permease [Burkholderiales bacterium]